MKLRYSRGIRIQHNQIDSTFKRLDRLAKGMGMVPGYDRQRAEQHADRMCQLICFAAGKNKICQKHVIIRQRLPAVLAGKRQCRVMVIDTGRSFLSAGMATKMRGFYARN